MNVRAVADRLTELVDETGAEVVFVCGEVRSRTDVVSALPDRVAARVWQSHAGARGAPRPCENEIRDSVDAEFEQRGRAAIDEVGRSDSAVGDRGRAIRTAPRKGWRRCARRCERATVETLIVVTS